MPTARDRDVDAPAPNSQPPLQVSQQMDEAPLRVSPSTNFHASPTVRASSRHCGCQPLVLFLMVPTRPLPPVYCNKEVLPLHAQWHPARPGPGAAAVKLLYWVFQLCLPTAVLVFRRWQRPLRTASLRCCSVVVTVVVRHPNIC
mmetsp:Transcript_102674/g.203836  ORF Transcript_102674/g.203836 Transcript_102674/m.203836 type:complete len:144 (-) Transcript_102674:210-641(-)